MIYGTPQFTIESDQIDLVGLRTLVLSKMWQPTRAFGDGGTFDLDEFDSAKPAPPALRGMQVFRDQTRRFGGVMRTFWIFEGVDRNRMRGRGQSLDYQFDPGFAQVDIALHPNLQKFLDEQGGMIIDGGVVFPATLGTGNTPNPMFGQKDFYRVEGTYTYRYLALNLVGLESGIGNITKNLPGAAPRYPNRDWLKVAVSYRCIGTAYEVMETYWLSGEGGWPKLIYGGGANGGSLRN